MTEYYRCFSCEKVAPLIGDAERRCPVCGGTNGEVLSQEQFEQGHEEGAIFDIDLKTGKRAKKKRR